jgi:hypothetical protein
VHSASPDARVARRLRRSLPTAKGPRRGLTLATAFIVDPGASYQRNPVVRSSESSGAPRPGCGAAVCLLASRSAAICKRTWLSLAWRSSRRRRCLRRCWSGQQAEALCLNSLGAATTSKQVPVLAGIQLTPAAPSDECERVGGRGDAERVPTHRRRCRERVGHGPGRPDAGGADERCAANSFDPTAAPLASSRRGSAQRRCDRRADRGGQFDTAVPAMPRNSLARARPGRTGEVPWSAAPSWRSRRFPAWWIAFQSC